MKIINDGVLFTEKNIEEAEVIFKTLHDKQGIISDDEYRDYLIICNLAKRALNAPESTWDKVLISTKAVKPDEYDTLTKDDFETAYMCNNYGKASKFKTNYCSYCGADMKDSDPYI